MSSIYSDPLGLDEERPQVQLTGDDTKEWLQSIISRLLELFPQDWAPAAPYDVGYLFMQALLERLDGLDIDPALKRAAMADFLNGSSVAVLEVEDMKLLEDAQLAPGSKVH